ncbi:MAG TPA: arginine deiminase family protein [Acidobacteriota bacterium]|nr:arginine deiminase family protein [Acidobacteriota bacterium]
MEQTAQSDVGRIRSILLKHPDSAFVSQEAIDAQWESLGYTAAPDFARARGEYERVLEAVSEGVDEITFLPRDGRTGLDSVYIRDALVTTDKGVIVCRMGKSSRAGEAEATVDALRDLGISVLGRIGGDGYLEGGDLIWLDRCTIAVGRGYRTNDEGIAQLRELTKGLVDEIITVPLPHWRGPGDVMHLMSLISPIDCDLAVVYSPLLPVPFREELIVRGITLIEVPDQEFATMGTNILAVAPRQCVMLAGNPVTRSLLEENGVTVTDCAGGEISLKGAGGPTCLTRPLLRDV